MLNNTANVDAAGVRSFTGLMIKKSRFIDNCVATNGADAAIQVLALWKKMFEANCA